MRISTRLNRTDFDEGWHNIRHWDPVNYQLLSHGGRTDRGLSNLQHAPFRIQIYSVCDAYRFSGHSIRRRRVKPRSLFGWQSLPRHVVPSHTRLWYPIWGQFTGNSSSYRHYAIAVSIGIVCRVTISSFILGISNSSSVSHYCWSRRNGRYLRTPMGRGIWGQHYTLSFLYSQPYGVYMAEGMGCFSLFNG